MSNVIEFPIKDETKKSEDDWSVGVREVQEATGLLLHELSEDEDLLWHRANIVETMMMELFTDLCVGASCDNEGAKKALEWLCEEINLENAKNLTEYYREEPSGVTH